MAFRSIARSSTCFVMGVTVNFKGISGPTRSVLISSFQVGLRLTRLAAEAGSVPEPPVSVPRLTTAKPEATEAALPPLEP